MSASSLPFLSFLSGAVALDKTPALCDDKSEKWTSYGDLRETIARLAPIWQSTEGRGLALCSLPRTTKGAIAFLSAAQAGQVILPVDPGTTRLPPLITAYEPHWIVTHTPSRPGELYDLVDWPLEDLFLWKRAHPTQRALHPDLFLLLLKTNLEHTVQTVRLSYRNVASNIEASLKALQITNEERALLTLPLSYSFGFSVLFSLLSVGGSLLLSEQNFKSRSFWEQAKKRETTLFPGIPLHYDYIARAGLSCLHVPRLKTFWQSGGRLPIERLQEILKQVTERKGAFYVLFGLTETSPRISVLPLHTYPDKLGSSGKIIQGGHVSVENGEIIYSGPNVMMGYAESKADLARGDEQNGRFETGEHGFMDEDGFLNLISR